MLWKNHRTIIVIIPQVFLNQRNSKGVRNYVCSRNRISKENVIMRESSSNKRVKQTINYNSYHHLIYNKCNENIIPQIYIDILNFQFAWNFFLLTGYSWVTQVVEFFFQFSVVVEILNGSIVESLYLFHTVYKCIKRICLEILKHFHSKRFPPANNLCLKKHKIHTQPCLFER